MDLQPQRTIWRTALIGVGVVSGLIGAAVLGGSASPAGATSSQFGAVTSVCEGVPEAPSAYFPNLVVTLYNLPANASPTASGSIAQGDSTPLAIGTLEAEPNVPGAYFVEVGGIPPALQGHAASVSITWTDGVGGGGSFGPQLVGIPACGGTTTQTPLPALSTVAIAANQAGTGYWIVNPYGGVAASGNLVSQAANYQALNYGGLAGVPLNAPIVGIAPTADGDGYWLLGRDGGVFSFGDARFYGSTGSLRLNAPVVAMAATPDGGGYWFVSSDGGVFAYGDATFYGSMGGHHLNAPIVGMDVDQATGGYWLVASDGGIFSFNASFYGSAGSLVLRSPIVGMQAAPDGSGYRLAASDGGVFSYDLPFAGSYTGQGLHPTVGITGQGSTGYWLLDSCGGVYSFGSAPFYGSASVC